jgi:ribonuclease HI
MWKRVISGGSAKSQFAALEQKTKEALFANADDPKVVIFGYDAVSISDILDNVTLHLKTVIITCDINGGYSNWFKQGIAVVPSGIPCGFAKTLIKRLSKLNSAIILVFWGTAIEYIEHAKDFKNVFILEDMRKFKECDHFKLISKLLTGSSKEKFDWRPNTLADHRKQIFENNVVIFTDGSCNPNKKCPEAVGGYAALVLCRESKIIYGRLDTSVHYATNIRAEGFAIVKALEYVKTLDLTSWNNLYLIGDCEMWCNMLNHYMKVWTDEQFKTGANPDITRNMWALWQELSVFAPNGEVLLQRNNTVIHMKSHNKSGWKNYDKDSYENLLFGFNELVDEYAKEGRALKSGCLIKDF